MEEIRAHAEQLARRMVEYEPSDEDRRYAEPLADVHRAVIVQADADEQLLAAVGAARARGVPWASIGCVVGTSGEAARQRYGPLVNVTTAST
jgi:hypothetical protein